LVSHVETTFSSLRFLPLALLGNQCLSNSF
jgi:hypothetical protein